MVPTMSGEFEDGEKEARLLHEINLKIQNNNVLEKLTELARIPERSRRRFKDVVHGIIFDAWESTETRKAESELSSDNPALARALESLRSAKQALADLDEPLRGKLWWPISEVETGIDRFFEWTIGDADHPMQPRKHRRGRRPGTVEKRDYQDFLRDLMLAAELAGGNLSFEKNIPTGTLLLAIKVVTPALPDGFISQEISASTLQRIKNSVRRRISNALHRTKKVGHF
jgi:hypothetical protein